MALLPPATAVAIVESTPRTNNTAVRCNLWHRTSLPFWSNSRAEDRSKRLREHGRHAASDVWAVCRSKHTPTWTRQVERTRHEDHGMKHKQRAMTSKNGPLHGADKKKLNAMKTHKSHQGFLVQRKKKRAKSIQRGVPEQRLTAWTLCTLGTMANQNRAIVPHGPNGVQIRRVAHSAKTSQANLGSATQNRDTKKHQKRLTE